MLKVLPIHVQKACIILKNPYIIIKRTLVERWTLKEFLVKAWKEMRNIWKLEEKQSLLFRVRKFSWILFHSIRKAELVSNDLECLAEEISKQSVECMIVFWFLHIVKYDRKNINWEKNRLTRLMIWKCFSLFKLQKMLKIPCQENVLWRKE